MGRKLKNLENEKYKVWDLEYGKKKKKTMKKLENEKQTLQHLEYGEKTEKREKIRNTHCKTRNMVRNTENIKNEKCTI